VVKQKEGEENKRSREREREREREKERKRKISLGKRSLLGKERSLLRVEGKRENEREKIVFFFFL
jgi:hypothetical protein